MKSRLKTISLCLLLLAGTIWAEEAQDLLARADRARGNLGGVRWVVKLDSIEREKLITRTYEVLSKDFDFRANATEPARLRGNRLLMKKGSMWFCKPDLSKPVAISQRQKLSGGAAYGDIAATNYAKDYEIIEERGEKLEDGTDCRVLTLKGKTKNVTYDKIIYWIDASKGVGMKAEYYSVSDKKLKTAKMEYKNKITGSGEKSHPFISSMIIHDELSNADTTMTFSEPELRTVSDRLLSVQSLKR